jgi:DNA-binding response OmpR family regulator
LVPELLLYIGADLTSRAIRQVPRSQLERSEATDVVNVTPSILITDDDRGFRETVRDLLEPQGFRTLLAADGEEALEIVRFEPVHLLVLDMHMPKLTGLETIREIKRIRALLPCILVSAAFDEELVRQAELQAFSVLHKPVSARKITQTVRLALRWTYNWR